MSGGREASLALLLVVLALAALVLVTTSPRSEVSDEDRASDTAASTTPSSQTSPSRSPIEAAGIDGHARRVATRWAAAYTTSKRDETWAARLARLRPYSTRALIAEMRVKLRRAAARARRPQ